MQVLIHNLLTSISLQNIDAIESRLDEDYESLTKTINFTEFQNFMRLHLFVHVRPADVEADDTILEKIDEVCWLVCAKSYLKNNKNFALKENATYRLWRVFNVLAHVDANDAEEEAVVPVAMEWEEVELMLQKIHRVVGTEFVKAEFRASVGSERLTFGFAALLDILELEHMNGVGEQVATSAVSELYEESVLGVLKSVG